MALLGLIVTFSPILKSQDTWHVTDIRNPAEETFYIGP